MRAPLVKKIYEPTTVEEALKILSENDEDTAIIAGGTDILGSIKDGVISPKALVDIYMLPMNYIEGSLSKGIRIGAATTAKYIAKSDQIRRELPVLYEAAVHLGGPQTQETATIGGNICNASPCGNFSNVLLALGANVQLSGPNGNREVLLKDFFTGPGKTRIQQGELLTEVMIPPITSDFGASYMKHVLRREMDIAIVGVAVFIVPEGNKIGAVRIALGSVGPIPFLAEKAQKMLEGKEYSMEAVEEAAKVVQEEEASYIDDVRASAVYRKEITAALVAEAVSDAWKKGGK